MGLVDCGNAWPLRDRLAPHWRNGRKIRRPVSWPHGIKRCPAAPRLPPICARRRKSSKVPSSFSASPPRVAPPLANPATPPSPSPDILVAIRRVEIAPRDGPEGTTPADLIWRTAEQPLSVFSRSRIGMQALSTSGRSTSVNTTHAAPQVDFAVIVMAMGRLGVRPFVPQE